MTRLPDQIHVAGAPAGWRVRATTALLLEGLRKTRLAAPSSALVVSLSCVGARPMTRLNRRYRGKRGVTDVLSFEQPAMRGLKGVRHLGDLVLCAPVVRRQAGHHGHGVRDEVAVLIAHGLLHLLGFDHERSAAEDARMARAEQRLLRAAGFGGQKSGLIARSKV